MKLIKYILFSLSLIFISPFSLAEDFFYRMDLRPPDEIFNNGFHNLGDNDDMLLHIEGESCFTGTRDSAFVSTTSDLDFAIQWGGDSTRGREFYVYDIRPTNNFYSLYESLMYAYRHSNVPVFREKADFFSEQQEWIAFGGISYSQIRSVRVYRSNGYGEAPTFIRTEMNINYDNHSTTHPNDGPYQRYYLPDNSDSSDACSVCSSQSASSRVLNNNQGRYDSFIKCNAALQLLLILKDETT